MKMTRTELMQLAVNEARKGMHTNIGGCFGAVVVKDDQVVSVTSNRVLEEKDPTAHAEITAIRDACKRLGTYDLSGCEMYATGYPCPMCLGAVIWSNIKTIYVSGLPQDAEEIGFRDDFIYRYIENGRNDSSVLDIRETDREPARKLYKEYSEMNKTIY